MNRTRSQDLLADHHPILDEDPLLISQTLTYVTDDGSVIHSFQSAPFSFGTSRLYSFIVLLSVVTHPACYLSSWKIPRLQSQVCSIRGYFCSATGMRCSNRRPWDCSSGFRRQSFGGCLVLVQ
jgi:hypothetical protein